MNRLMICAGSSRCQGWMTLDADPKKGADFVATIPPLPAEVKAIAWDEIEWIHGITSLYPWDAREAVRELREVLAPSGKLAMEQPDARQCDAVMYPQWLFGDPSLRDPLHMNKWIYTPESLSTLLRSVGFSRVEIMLARHHIPSRDFRVEAYR